MNTETIAPKIFGIFFILAFVAYALGNGLVESVVNSAESLSSVFSNKGQVAFGAVLISVVHTFINLVVASIMLSLLKQHNRIVAFGYFTAVLIATALVAIGAIFMLLLIPLSDEFMEVGATERTYLQLLSTICVKGNYYAYQIGMAIWGIGGLMLCYLLYLSKLVPKLFSLWGFIGYLFLIVGAMSELFGLQIGVLLAIPGGLFEICLSIWLIIKGINRQHVSVTGLFPNGFLLPLFLIVFLISRG